MTEKIDTAKNSSDTAFRRWIYVIIFAIAFAWVESSVVVYLQKIYYDGAFAFPVVVILENGKYVIDYLMRIELGREIATIIMLIAIGCVAGKSKLQKLSFFMIAFGIWDIFYYVWLKVMINWPENLMTWDLLFLIPLPWVGPVITPIFIALMLIVAGSLIIYIEEQGFEIQFCWYDWVIELGCAALLIVAFCWDWKNIIQYPDGILRSGIPNPFAWWLYLPAYIFAVLYFILRFSRIIKYK